MSLKTLIGTAIIGLGIAGIIFVIQNSAPSFNPQNLTAQSNNFPAPDKPFVEPMTDKSPLSYSNKENLTGYLAKGLGKILAKYNPDGPFTFNNQKSINVPNPDAIAEDLLAEAVQKFDPNSLKPAIKESGLKISNNNSKESLTAYFSDFQRAINESAALLSQKTLSATEINPEQIDELILMYDAAFKKLQTVPVPSSLVKIHKKELELLGTKSAIYRAFKNYEEDPLLSIIASQNLRQIEQEFSDLDKEIAEFIKNNNL